MTPIIAISMGDYNGIGPEVIIKTLAGTDLSLSTPVILGNHSVIEFYKKKTGLQLPLHKTEHPGEVKIGTINLLETSGDDDIDLSPGVLSASAGKASMVAVEKGVDLCLSGISDALVTAPISKEAIHQAGYGFPGHTEFLAEKTSARDYMMILASESESLRVGLVTIHIPLKDVARSISSGTVGKHLRILHKSLKLDFGLESPKIAVLGLNPHAGDGGVLGDEETNIIKPAIEQSVKTEPGLNAEGPFAADGFFGSTVYKKYDAVLAMYHDQGLIPFKTLTFGRGVNITAGLPVIRTSPDHGTGFDIAGKNAADESSFKAAYQMAYRMTVNKKMRKSYEKNE